MENIAFFTRIFALKTLLGRNNLLARNNARYYGFKAALFAGFGQIVAFSVTIALAALGLSVMLNTLEFFDIKLVGALYLLWIAYHFSVFLPQFVEVRANVDEPFFELAALFLH